MRVLRARTVIGIPAVGLLLLALSPSAHQLRTIGASLEVTPSAPYVGGQAMTFAGSLGISGQRRVHVQSWMGRPGDTWTTVKGFHAMTRPDGSFSFAYPSPSMFGIHLRVVGGGAATPDTTFDAQSQDLTVALDRGLGSAGTGVQAGTPFTLLVDTTPVIPHRPDLPAPAIPGRTITLQQRVNGDQWRTLATTTTDDQGQASFVRSLDSADGPQVTYRVRQEDWTAGGSTIGWFPSFPYTVTVLDPGTQDTPPVTDTTGTTSTRPPSDTAAVGQNGRTASKMHGWRGAIWDFAWEYGESLTSRPFRGTDRHGWWADSSDGSGRVGKLNGGLVLDSQRYFSGPGDYGTTRATLHQNPATYGRWEVRMRTKEFEYGAGSYHALIELVPDNPAAYHCGAQNITIADVPVGGDGYRFGVKSLGGQQWTRSKSVTFGDTAAAFGVEVMADHVSWFLNGETIGTVKSAAAVSDVPMTLRISLVGNGDHEMNHTQLLSDWQRGWDLAHGDPVTNGASLKAGTFTGAC